MKQFPGQQTADDGRQQGNGFRSRRQTLYPRSCFARNDRVNGIHPHPPITFSNPVLTICQFTGKGYSPVKQASQYPSW